MGLTKPQMVELHRIYLDSDSEFGGAGWADTAPARNLRDLGLVRQWDDERSLGGGGVMGAMKVKWALCDLTDEGHAYHEDLGLPLNDRDRKFISRRSGACVPTLPALRSCLARGLVMVTDTRPGAYTSWRRVPGKAERWR